MQRCAERFTEVAADDVPFAVGAVLHAVAADLHRAPVAAAVLRSVEERPAARVRGADLQPLPAAVDLRPEDDADHLGDQGVDRSRRLEVEVDGPSGPTVPGPDGGGEPGELGVRRARPGLRSCSRRSARGRDGEGDQLLPVLLGDLGPGDGRPKRSASRGSPWRRQLLLVVLEGGVFARPAPQATVRARPCPRSGTDGCRSMDSDIPLRDR